MRHDAKKRGERTNYLATSLALAIVHIEKEVMQAVKMMMFVPKKRLLGIHIGLQFEGVHLPADGRLADAQLLTSVREAALLRGGVKHTQLVPIHG